MPILTRSGGNFGLPWLAYAAFVIYGSLVPLDYRPLPLEEALTRFAATPFLTLGAESRADWIANGVLYFPLGALTASALSGWLPRLRIVAMVLAWASCAALAVGVEFAQLHFPPRTVSLNDLMAEAIGAALGVMAAPRLAHWGRRLLHATQARLGQSPRLLGRAWLLGLVVLALFPFDFVLSAAEWAQRLASDNVAWWWVPDARGTTLGLLRWAVEAALVVPLGVAWAWGGRGGVQPAATKALLAGLVLGALIELAQLLLVSGVAQGSSVLGRGLGAALGAVLALRLSTARLPDVQALLGRAGIWLALPYLGTLLLANGWFRSPWRDAAQASATWAEVRLLPFYYHYYTSEAVALVSLLSVALMYAPLALWGWARGASAAAVGLAVAVLSLVVEASKLLLGGMRPDPTNVLIAAMACAGVVALLGWAARLAQAAPGGALAAPVAAAESGSGAASAAPTGLALSLVLICQALAATLPGPTAMVVALVGGILVACAAVAWRPWLAAAIVPAALPALDLATLTGRVWVDEFDLLLLACSAVVAARAPIAPRATRAAGRGLGAAQLPLALLLASCGLGVLASLWPLPRLDTGGLADPMNSLAALHIGKGALLVGVYVAMLGRLANFGPLRDRAVVAGMVAGLTWTVGVVLWERMTFVSLLDFESVYRVTGPFSAMHRGGAYLEAYLALASAFLLIGLLRPQPLAARLLAAALLGATGYAMMVTYSRNGYVAWAVVLLLGLLLITPQRAAGAGAAPRWLRGAAVAGLALAVALPIALTGFARERIERSLQDLQVRQAHWMDAIALRPDSPARLLFGAGLGRFPEAHFWGSREAVRAATIHLRREGAQQFLQMGTGSPTYVEQWVWPPASGTLTLQMQLRVSPQPGVSAVSADAASVVPAVGVSVSLCEKWLLTSARCETARVLADAPAAPGWLHGQAELTGFTPTPGRPLKFTLMAPTGGGAIEVASVSLRSADGREWLTNGDFASGLARWFWSTDVDPPWHIHSLPVALWFDLGWVGVVLWTLALGLAAMAALRRWQRGQVLASAALVALAGFMTSGLVNTLVDAPRFLMLVLLLVWLCSQDDATTRLQRSTSQKLP